MNFSLTAISANLKRITGIELAGYYNTGRYQMEPYTPDESGIRYDSIGIEVSNELLLSSNMPDIIKQIISHLI